MSLDLARKSLQLFDDELFPSTAPKHTRLDSKKKKRKGKKAKREAIEAESSASLDRKAEALMRSTLVSRLKTPDIIDQIVKQQQNRQSHGTRRLQSTRKRKSTPNAVASSTATWWTTAAAAVETANKPATDDSEGTIFTEEDFQRFFESYKPPKLD